MLVFKNPVWTFENNYFISVLEYSLIKNNKQNFGFQSIIDSFIHS